MGLEISAAFLKKLLSPMYSESGVGRGAGKDGKKGGKEGGRKGRENTKKTQVQCTFCVLLIVRIPPRGKHNLDIWCWSSS